MSKAITFPTLSPRTIAAWAPWVAIFLLVFWPALTWMAARFEAADSFYSHGWLIPLATGWLIWQRRGTLAAARPAASFSGFWLLVPALLIHVVATSIDLHFVSGFAMIVAVWGLAWVLWGWRVLWTLRFPMFFLLFMVPLPGVLLIYISFQMKLMAATLATYFLHWINIPAVQAGSTIQLPGVSIIVDDTCSGLRSLISLIALSTLWTSLMPLSSPKWQRVTVVASSIPIALAANMVRIITLVLITVIYGPKAAEGFIHYGSGIVVFGIALIALAWLTRGLAGLRPSVAGRAG